MFNESTHKKHWLFQNLSHVLELRKQTYELHLETYKPASPITLDEQNILVRHYAKELIKFCSVFQPPVPNGAIYTALTYFRRIYLRQPALQLQPRDVMFSCAYLAFKVDEYNLSIDQFLKVLPKEMQQQVGFTVISFELTIMSTIDCELTVYNPYRPLHGLLTDMKVRLSEDIEQLEEKSGEYLSMSILTDVVFLYPPSQVALCAIYMSAQALALDILEYMEKIFSDQPDGMRQALKMIQEQDSIVKSDFAMIQGDAEWKAVEKKLDGCKNPEFDPRGSQFVLRAKSI